ncbi:hypothetical protein [Pseudalkalibacillus decolorationis]|uniref:hypothetical protein n=1 Tax=Pseudalkalibacillus decolorationis TaxID=163879 RepID=UPI0021473A40|nr:hypothetical protein [Pseudalkalibacillus decolorationis]
MATLIFACVAFLLVTFGVCGLVKRLTSVDTIEHDVYHLWEEFGYTREDYFHK